MHKICKTLRSASFVVEAYYTTNCDVLSSDERIQLSHLMTDIDEAYAAAKRHSIINCLKAAVEYCKEQYEVSYVDRLPPLDGVDELTRYKELEDFLNNL